MHIGSTTVPAPSEVIRAVGRPAVTTVATVARVVVVAPAQAWTHSIRPDGFDDD